MLLQTQPFIVGGGRGTRGNCASGGFPLFQRRRVGVVGMSRATSSAGILPYSQSKSVICSVSVDESVSVRWGHDFQLPGHGEAHISCGSWRSRACLNVDAHKSVLLDGTSIEGKVYVERYQTHCYRAECPVCYENWAAREAGKIEHRMLFCGWIGKAIHVVLSPSEDVVKKAKSFEQLRSEAYRIAKLAGFKGGCCIPHPYRRKCGICGAILKTGYRTCLFCGSSSTRWVFGFHFHLIGYGWIKGAKELYEETGWVVKNLGVRESVFATAMYQLSHAGIRKGHHVVIWFGRLSYNNLKAPKLLRKEHRCPVCDELLRHVIYVGEKELPEEKGGFWSNLEGWIAVPNRFGQGDYG